MGDYQLKKFGYTPNMDEFLKMDIFFVVATISVVALSFFAAFVLWRLERVLKNVEHISGQIALESDSFRKDLADMRDEIRRGKGRLKSLFAFLGSFVKKPAKKSKS
jgi:hypothetical protein